MLKERTQPNDVRMRGFSGRTLVESAWAWIDQYSVPLEAENVSLDEAHHRILAEDVTASVDVPSFDRAAMDGYALRGAGTVGAGPYNPLIYPIVGESMPGRPFEGSVATGAAVRIMTGAPIPQGADAVLPAEYANERNKQVEITTAVAPGKHVGQRGEDIRQGEVVLRAGRRLRPQDIGVLASVGVARIKVVRRPRVRILATGDELVSPGQPKGAYQIFDSNSSMLRGLLVRDGGILESHRKLVDDRKAIREALVEPGAEVILISGGSSVGAEDHAPTLIAEEGELAIHGIAMRPSSPAGMGRLGAALVFLLPGNPVSCLCAYDFFAGRAIRLLGGASAAWPHLSRTLTVGKKIVSAVGRVDYCRVRVDGGQVEPLALSGASILSSTTRADGFVIVPAESEGYGPGAEVTVYLYETIC
jgi:molybdopterin molybdotransferase